MQKLWTFAILLLLASAVSAQILDAKLCGGPVYGRKDVSNPAKMIEEPNFQVLYQAFGNGVSARVSLEAVLCRSGRVTDIRIIKSEPSKVGEFVVAALSLVRFKPAELNWHTVSQRQQFEFNINQGETSAIDVAAAAGRMIDELDVMGNRRLSKEQILAMIKTRAGDIYNQDQIQRDLLAMLATGNFNANGTRVLLDDAPRGGVRVIFEVFELPLITEVKFERLNENDRRAIVDELRKHGVELQKGTPFDPAKVKKAARVIEGFLESKGWRDVKAEAFTESPSATEVTLTFKITAYKFGQ